VTCVNCSVGVPLNQIKISFNFFGIEWLLGSWAIDFFKDILNRQELFNSEKN
jgi:hypothetical protein